MTPALVVGRVPGYANLFYWGAPHISALASGFRPKFGNARTSIDDALKEAWEWYPELPALIYTRRP